MLFNGIHEQNGPVSRPAPRCCLDSQEFDFSKVVSIRSGEITKMNLATPVEISEIRGEEGYTGGGKVTYNRGKQGAVIKIGIGFEIGLGT